MSELIPSQELENTNDNQEDNSQYSRRRAAMMAGGLAVAIGGSLITTGSETHDPWMIAGGVVSGICVGIGEYMLFRSPDNE